MSYCRWGPDSAVYMYKAVTDNFVCCMCGLNKDSSFVCGTEQEMLDHLQAHRSFGHQVPEPAFERLRREISEKEDGTGTGSRNS